jgi:transmembrane sensor
MEKLEPNTNEILITTYLAGELPEKEVASFRKRIKTDSEFRKLYLETRTIWDCSKPIADKTAEEVENNFEAFWKKAQTRKTPSQNIFRITIWSSAIAALFVVGFFAFQLLVNNKAVEYSSNDVAMQNISLPDGSIVDLNAHSKLTFAKSFFKRNRSVTLIGEAFFKVTPNKNSPFVISTQNTQIKVVGTSFNIKSLESADTITVSVKTGIVKFLNENQSGVLLKSGETGFFDKKNCKFSVQTLNNELIEIWKTGDFTFEHIPLKKALEELQKHFEVELRSENSEIAEIYITASFKNQTLSSILTDLSYTLDLNFSVKNNQIFIGKAPK